MYVKVQTKFESSFGDPDQILSMSVNMTTHIYMERDMSVNKKKERCPDMLRHLHMHHCITFGNKPATDKDTYMLMLSSINVYI